MGGFPFVFTNFSSLFFTLSVSFVLGPSPVRCRKTLDLSVFIVSDWVTETRVTQDLFVSLPFFSGEKYSTTFRPFRVFTLVFSRTLHSDFHPNPYLLTSFRSLLSDLLEESETRRFVDEGMGYLRDRGGRRYYK